MPKVKRGKPGPPQYLTWTPSAWDCHHIGTWVATEGDTKEFLPDCNNCTLYKVFKDNTMERSPKEERYSFTNSCEMHKSVVLLTEQIGPCPSTRPENNNNIAAFSRIVRSDSEWAILRLMRKSGKDYFTIRAIAKTLSFYYQTVQEVFCMLLMEGVIEKQNFTKKNEGKGQNEAVYKFTANTETHPDIFRKR